MLIMLQLTIITCSDLLEHNHGYPEDDRMILVGQYNPTLFQTVQFRRLCDPNWQSSSTYPLFTIKLKFAINLQMKILFLKKISCQFYIYFVNKHSNTEVYDLCLLTHFTIFFFFSGVIRCPYILYSSQGLFQKKGVRSDRLKRALWFQCKGTLFSHCCRQCVIQLGGLRAL